MILLFKEAKFWLLYFYLCTFSAFSQDILWESSYGGNQSEYLLDAIQTTDKGYLLAGSSLSTNNGTITSKNKGNLDYWICKMNPIGEIEWQKNFGGKGMDLLQTVKATPDGGYLLSGISNSDIEGDKTDACKGDTDYWIIKVDAKGNEQWQRTIGGNGQERIGGITITSNGDYIIAGSSSSEKTPLNEKNERDPFGKHEKCRGNLDFWLVKLTKEGNLSWQKTIGGKFKDELRAIVSLPNQEYLLGGYSNSPISGEKTDKNIGVGDYWIIKINSTGTIIWQKTLGGNQDDNLFCLTLTRDGGFIIGGNSNSTTSNSKSKGNARGTDYWVVKMTEDGEVHWQETYNFGETDVLTSIIENPDGTFLLSGYAQTELKNSNTNGKIKFSTGDKEGINDYIALKINDKGEKIWEKTVGSKGDEVMRKIYPTSDGGYWLAGTSFGNKSRDKKSPKGKGDFWVVKLKDKTKEDKNILVTAIPNPTISETNISVNFQYEKGTASLYDISGRKLQYFEIKGEQQIPIALGNLPTGIYIVNIKTNTEEQSIKIIKR